MTSSTLRIQRTGHGPNLALLHGWGIGSAIWQNLLPMLNHYFCVHRISLPGYDDSPEDDNDFNTTANALLTHLPANTHLCGWSLGAQLAFRANAGKLVIGHFSSRYKDLTPHLLEAHEEFKNSYLAMEGVTISLR